MSRIFFDLDGTLTDPKPGVTGCIQYALTKLQCPVPSPDELEWCIGPPLAETFGELAGHHNIDRAIELYRERFSTFGLYENQIYDGIVSVLDELRSKHHELYVASSKPRVYVDQILEHFDLRSRLNAAFGAELDGTRSAKSELLQFALAQTRTDPADAIMIGDRSHDAIGAQANEIPFVGVLYGYGTAGEFADVGVTRLAGTPQDLLTFL